MTRTRSPGSPPRSASPRPRRAACLASDAYAAEVEADIEEARAIGVNGVPFFVLDRRYGISGAQPGGAVPRGPPGGAARRRGRGR